MSIYCSTRHIAALDAPNYIVHYAHRAFFIGIALLATYMHFVLF